MHTHTHTHMIRMIFFNVCTTHTHTHIASEPFYHSQAVVAAVAACRLRFTALCIYCSTALVCSFSLSIFRIMCYSHCLFFLQLFRYMCVCVHACVSNVAVCFSNFNGKHTEPYIWHDYEDAMCVHACMCMFEQIVLSILCYLYFPLFHLYLAFIFPIRCAYSSFSMNQKNDNLQTTHTHTHISSVFALKLIHSLTHFDIYVFITLNFSITLSFLVLSSMEKFALLVFLNAFVSLVTCSRFRGIYSCTHHTHTQRELKLPPASGNNGKWRHKMCVFCTVEGVNVQ